MAESGAADKILSLNVTETTEPGSTARAQHVDEITRSHEQPYIDQTLLHRLAELVLARHDRQV